MSSRYIKILIPAVALVVTAGAAAAIPLLKERFTKKVLTEPQRITIKENNAQDKAIIAELSRVLHAMDTVTVLTVNGSMEGQDLADSTSNLQSSFCYTRGGNQAYYQLGDHEMISLPDAYIVVAHDLKKIFLSPPKEIINPMRLPIKTEVDFLAHESYTVSRKTEGLLTKISLINPTHASCREYMVSFDTLNIVRNAVMRMTNPEVLTDPTKDKILKVAISSWELGIVRRDLLRKDKYVSVVNGIVMPATRLRDYELIKE